MLDGITTRPHKLESYKPALQYYIENGELDAAEEVCSRAKGSLVLRVRELLAMELFDHGNFTRCQAVVEELLRENQDSVLALTVAGQLQTVGGQLGKAIRTLRRAHSLNNDLDRPKLAMLRVARVRNDLKQADHWLRLLSDDDPPAKFLVDVMFACVNTANFKRFSLLSNPLERLSELHVATLSNILGFPAIRAQNDSDENALRFLEFEQLWCEWATETASKNPIERKEWSHKGNRLKLGFFGLASIQLLRSLLYMMVERLDREAYEVVLAFALDNKSQEDSVRPELDALKQEAKIDNYILIEGTNQQVAQQLHDQEIDVLIDLNGLQQAGTRLGALAWKPAKLQITWAGTPTNCGLSELDYQILDPYLVPEEGQYVTDKPLVLPRSWVCFGEFPDYEIGPEVPSESNGFVTFGVNALPNRLNAKCFDYWAQILKRLPGSQLVFLNQAYKNPIVRMNVLEQMTELEVGDRVAFRFDADGKRGHMKWFNDIDVILDRVPISGGMGVLEALYMGVPVVSFVGPAVHTRLAWSQFNHLGIADLCCRDMDLLVEKAVEIALDTARRTGMRATLREKINGDTSFTDIDAFMGEFHHALAGVCREANLV